MGSVYAALIILAIAAIIKYPIASVAIIVLLVFLFVKLLNSDEKSSLDKSADIIKMAVKDIEDAYQMATEYSVMEPSVLTMYIYEEHNQRGYQVVLYTMNDYNSGILENAIGDKCGWKILKDDDGDYYIDRTFTCGVESSWITFNKAVWEKVKNKHPSWKVKYIRDNKSVINF